MILGNRHHEIKTNYSRYQREGKVRGMRKNQEEKVREGALQLSEDQPEEEIEVSVVMPCLNEEKAIGLCIQKVKKVFTEERIKGEIIVSDNGSTDRSVEIAQSLGARVVHQPERGYGNAYRKGLDAARGTYIVMGDSDNTYDFLDIKRFLDPLKDRYDLVMGNRFGGKILPGAMPWLHRYIGNPVLSGILNLLFHTKISLD